MSLHGRTYCDYLIRFIFVLPKENQGDFLHVYRLAEALFCVLSRVFCVDFPRNCFRIKKGRIGLSHYVGKT